MTFHIVRTDGLTVIVIVVIVVVVNTIIGDVCGMFGGKCWVAIGRNAVNARTGTAPRIGAQFGLR